MKTKILMALALFCAAPAGAMAQNAPQCASPTNVSDMVKQVFDVFVNPNAAELRASRGIETQAEAAPRGLLHDNAACALLRTATIARLAAQGILAPRKVGMSFLRLGDYVGVFVAASPDSSDVVVSGTRPLYVFKAALVTPAGGERKFNFVTELRF